MPFPIGHQQLRNWLKNVENNYLLVKKREQNY